MYQIKRLLRLLRSIPSSIIFNFYYLPFFQAYKLPILCYKLHFNKLSGCVVIDSPKVSFGMIKLGFKVTELFPNSGLTWRNEGKIIFNGRCNIGNDSYVFCGKNGSIVFGDRFLATGNIRIVSETGVFFDNNVLIGWGTIILDTDFHPLYDMVNCEFNKGFGQIRIGSGCWLAAYTICLHSVTIPEHCVFGIRSLITHSARLKNNCLYGGSPIKLLKENVRLDDVRRSLEYEL